MNEKSIREAAI